MVDPASAHVPPGRDDGLSPAARRSRNLGNAFAKKTLGVVLVGLTAIALALYLASDIQRRSERQVELQAREADELLALLAGRQISSTVDERRHHLQILALRLQQSPLIDAQKILREYTSDPLVADDHVVFLDRRGTIVASTRPSEIGKDESRTEAFTRATPHAGHDVVATFAPFVPSSGLRAYELILSIPVRENGGASHGVVEIRIDIPSLVGELMGKRARQHVALIASDGTVLFHSRVPESVSESISAPPASCFSCHDSLGFAHAMEDARGGSLLHVERGRKVQAFAFSTVDVRDSRLLLVLSHDEVAAAFTRQTKRDSFLLVVVVLMVTVVSSIVIFHANRERVEAAAEAREWKQSSALESALRNAEQHYRTIVESSHDLIWMLDADARFTFANRRLEETTGYSSRELTGRAIHDFVAECDAIALAIIEGKTDIRTTESEARFRTKDGRILILEVSSVVVDAEGPRVIVCSARDVTARRDADATLRRTQRDYQSLVDSIPGIVWRADPKTLSFDVVSEQVRAILGYEPKEWLFNEEFWIAHLHPDDREWAPRFCAEQSARGVKHDFEYRMIARDGSVVWLHDVVNVEMEDGEPKRLSGVMVDITAAKESQIRLRESEARFQAIFEQTTLGIALRDRNGMLIEVNPAVPAMLGYSVDELRERPVLALAHPEDRELVASAFHDLWTGSPKPLLHQWRHRRKNGSFMWGRVTLSLIRDEYGKPTMSVTMLEDVSEQVTAAQERMRLATAIDQAGEAVVVTDHRGRIEYVNPAFELITGYPRLDVVGRTPSILKSGKHDVEFYKSMWDRITSGETWNGRIVNRRRDGSFYEADATISPMLDATGRIDGFVAVQRDVTEHVALLEKLRRAEEMEAFGRLVSGVAHEVRNPLGAIQAATGALELDFGDIPEHARFFSIIKGQVDRLTRLMRELLDLGKPLQESRVGVHSISELCENSINVWRNSYPNEPSSRVRFSGSGEEVEVKADPSRLQQVIVNLLDNAMQHSGHDSTIVVAVEGNGDGCRITVRDAGIGVEGGEFHRVFEPFFTTRKGGTGLGLTLVRNIVEQHGGTVAIYNNDPPPGATAELMLPIVRRAEATA